MDKPQTEPLLSLMKKTRQSTGLLFLAYEQQEFDTVLELETTAREAVEVGPRHPGVSARALAT